MQQTPTRQQSSTSFTERKGFKAFRGLLWGLLITVPLWIFIIVVVMLIIR